jgi:hypothetical protein
VNHRGDRIDEELNVQRLGFPFWKSHGGIICLLFGRFPNPSKFLVGPVSISANEQMLAPMVIAACCLPL